MRKERTKSACQFCGFLKRDSDGCRRVACGKGKKESRSGHEMSFEEIGSRLNLSRQTVSQIYTKAIAKMRRKLEKENGK